MTENVVEKRSCNGQIRVLKFLTRDTREVGDIGQDIEDCDKAHGSRECDTQSSLGVFDFRQYLILLAAIS